MAAVLLTIRAAMSAVFDADYWSAPPVNVMVPELGRALALSRPRTPPASVVTPV
jgi:hypothetical protein